ncbi:MAG: FAD-dependent oxidoreductase [Actinobacteria bacterium]|nr:FAD-dependent oxidoreductase [Actinomycetota bacterium]
MREYEVVIIGGSAAGLTAAITTKRFYPDKKVLIIRREENVLIPCGIPYIYGAVGSTAKNLIPDAVLEKNGIDLLIGEVVEIKKDEKIVESKKGEKVKYEKLIIASGSDPVIPPINGSDKDNVFIVKKDEKYLDSLLNEVNKAKDMVIIGGGFIGMEFADECKKNRDINISVVEMLPHCLMLVFDEEFCKQGEELIIERGVNIITNEKVEEITGNGKVESVKLANGKNIKADIVLVGIGVRPNIEIARNAGIGINEKGTIKVDRYMRTSDENIFACGDCCEKFSFFDKEPVNLMLASIATNEARIAGANLYEINRSNEGVIGTYSTVIGETALARSGLSVYEARANGYDIVTGQAEGPNCHPGCMPGSSNLKVSLIFEKGTGIILGGQLIGAKSGGELINLISGCIHKKMTANDIATFQMGTHPALTASPIAYQISNAAEMAVKELRKK